LAATSRSLKPNEQDVRPQIYNVLLSIAFVTGMGAPSIALAQDLRSGVSMMTSRFEIPPDLAGKVGRTIWMNETGGDEQAITAWNDHEDFMSLGIGHFIWLPAARPRNTKRAFPRCWSFFGQRD
jgi:hypothetical protein